MLATFFIELALAVYVVTRFYMTTVTRLITVALVALAVFQLSEYFVCGGAGAEAVTWSRIGFVAITALPIVGLHLLYSISGRQSRKLVALGYATMAMYMSYFLLAPNAFTGQMCTGNYVIYQISSTAALFYQAYYYGWLLVAILFGYKSLTNSNNNKKIRQQIGGLILGYLIFLVPTGIANTIKPETRAGIPSIMCGFAVLFAFILVLYIAPRTGVIRRKITVRFLPRK